MFERLNAPDELFKYQLGSALTMEQKLVEVLEELEEHAQRGEVKTALRDHREQTRQHVLNIEQCFRALGEDVEDNACPTIEAMAKEGKATIKKTDEALVDNVILAAAGESEHHEIAVYEALIVQAEARGAEDVAQLLRQNLSQEQHALETVRDSFHQVASQTGTLAGRA